MRRQLARISAMDGATWVETALETVLETALKTAFKVRIIVANMEFDAPKVHQVATTAAWLPVLRAYDRLLPVPCETLARPG